MTTAFQLLPTPCRNITIDPLQCLIIYDSITVYKYLLYSHSLIKKRNGENQPFHDSSETDSDEQLQQREETKLSAGLFSCCQDFLPCIVQDDGTLIKEIEAACTKFDSSGSGLMTEVDVVSVLGYVNISCQHDKGT